MKRKQTKRSIPVSEFRKLNRCITCGFAYELSCPHCEGKTFIKCEVCEIILRTEPRVVFYYDIYVRGDGDFKLSNKDIKEFIYDIPVLVKKGSDTHCADCINWEDKVKNLCQGCGDKIIRKLPAKTRTMKRNGSNTRLLPLLKKHYCLYGNYCKECYLF